MSVRRKRLSFAALALFVVGACTESGVTPPTTGPRGPIVPSFAENDPFNSTGSCFAADVFKAGFLQQVQDSLGNQSLESGGCTSNDVRIATADVISYSINGGPEIPFEEGDQVSCGQGDILALRLAAHVEETATSQRTDIGIWIADDAGNARTGVCKHFNLTNDSTGVIDFDSDSCGDMDAGGEAIVGLGTINAICQGATPNDTLVHIGSCLGWTQPGTGGDDRTCPTTSSRQGIPNPAPGSPDAFRYGTTPGTTSKCNCQGFDVPILVTQTAKIELKKECSPTTDPGTFDLLIDGSTSDAAGTFGEDKACQTTTGQRTVSAGTNVTPGATHDVKEDGFSIAPSNYTSTVSCTKNGNAYIPSQSYTAGTDLEVQTNPDDVVVCTFVNTRKGSLTIVKNTIPDGPQDFSFTSTGGLSPSSFSLDDDGDPTLSNSQSFTGLTPGAYSVTEAAQAGFDLTALTCSDANSTGNTTTRTATINIEAGESVTCTFTNTQRGAINIVKNTVPDGPQDFAFTSNIAGNANFSLDDDGDPTLSNTNAIANVVPGQYTVTEGSVGGFALTALSCNDANSTTNLGTRTATINVEPGETVTCTFTNTQGGSITIVKDAIPNGGTNFSFSCGAGLAPATFDLDDDADPALSNSQTYSGVTPGQYTCTETVPTGWDLTALVCSDANSTEDLGTATATINVEAGESVTCTYTNTQRGSITIVKILQGPGTTFTFNTNSGASDTPLPNPINIVVPTDGSNNSVHNNLKAGTYAVTEVVPSGYTLTDLACTGSFNQVYDPGVTQTATIILPAGGAVTCTFINNGEASDVTRTQGFWSTHVSITQAVWFGGTAGGNTFPGVADKNLCDIAGDDIDTIGKLLGGFWSSIPFTSTKDRRSDLDQARMKLLQQLLAAILNNAAFGSSPSGPISIADATAAYCGTDIAAINAAAAAMGAFNESGDSEEFTPGASANGKLAKSLANLAFWDVLP